MKVNNKKYKYLFFDLDNTLWDFESNAVETLKEIYNKYHLEKYFEDFNTLVSSYWLTKNNLSQCLDQNITGVDSENLIKNILADFDILLLKKTTLMPNTIDILNYLNIKYEMFIITNGNHNDQLRKLESSQLLPYFKKIYTSERIGSKKPHKLFFEYAIKSSNAKKTNSLVIGDGWNSDIKGAASFGIDSIYINNNTIEANTSSVKSISNLKELQHLL